MGSLYANRQLGEAVARLGTVDRFPRIGVDGAEAFVTLAIATSPTGHVQAVMCLDIVRPDGHTLVSTPLGFYPVSSQDLAYADAVMLDMKLGLSIRRSDAARGWIVDHVDRTDYPGGQAYLLEGR